MSAKQHVIEASTRIRMKFEESLISILGVGVACSADMPGESILNDLVTEASKASSKFATKEVHVTGSNITLYSLAQCTQDLSTAVCNSCLRVAVAHVVSTNGGIDGGQFICPSCNVRYETVPFYGKPRVHHIPPPPPPPPPQGRRKPLPVIVASIVASINVCAVLVAIGYYFPGRRRSSRNKHKVQGEEKNARNDIAAVESLQLDLETIETATNKFSDSNKLGQGGFGEVFKGTLGVNGQEIAVKRLSKSSVQGVQELKNELLLIAKLQHRNLVKLLGFCLEGEETILVYEYVPDKSLDYFLNGYRIEKREQLDWSRHCMIIGGIAQEILYLHEDSRLRVIHRDLKPSNILLDVNMNPKISNFGMARMFGVDDQTEGNTRRIDGTYGYMTPKYAMGGFCSIKSNVFSFGVLLLEIVTGRRNFLGFHVADTAATLLAHDWQLWNEGKVLELMDPLLKDSCSAEEFSRYIHIGLLCVQQDANHRPTMSSVALMMKTETISFSKPEQPAFFAGRSTAHRHQTSAHSWSANGLTISEDVPRREFAAATMACTINKLSPIVDNRSIV
ncbi:cysteine-rich receptor-like protein kinase 10 [Pyrus communis]|uniref:cysteine-rich receptor-like protein kinase 10 n=1 Tax=Pyrus communis TaxID=23211 RepID=UPI0035BEF4E3